MSHFSLRLKSWSLLACLVFLFGCGQGRHQETLDRLYPDRQAVARVSGKLLVDGIATPNLFLRLVPIEDTAPSPENPQTFTTETGEFAFSTYLQGDGVPLGKYRLLVEQLKSQGDDVWSGPDGLKNLFNQLDNPVDTLDVVDSMDGLQIDLEAKGKPARREPKYGVTQLGDRRGGRR